MAKRLMAMGQANYANGFQVTLHERALELPLSWTKPQKIFVDSMSDLFHESVPVAFIQRVFDVMLRADWHQFQVLTKRSKRLWELDRRLTWARHIWMGVSVENNDYVERVDDLRGTRAHVKFVSCEPLLSSLPDLNLNGIDWVIVGGESGPKARPMEESWVLNIRTKCRKAGVPFFFKQWGGPNKKKAGRLLQGRTYDELPGERTGGYYVSRRKAV